MGSFSGPVGGNTTPAVGSGGGARACCGRLPVATRKRPQARRRRGSWARPQVAPLAWPQSRLLKGGLARPPGIPDSPRGRLGHWRPSPPRRSRKARQKNGNDATRRPFRALTLRGHGAALRLTRSHICTPMTARIRMVLLRMVLLSVRSSPPCRSRSATSARCTRWTSRTARSSPRCPSRSATSARCRR